MKPIFRLPRKGQNDLRSLNHRIPTLNLREGSTVRQEIGCCRTTILEISLNGLGTAFGSLSRKKKYDRSSRLPTPVPKEPRAGAKSVPGGPSVVVVLAVVTGDNAALLPTKVVRGPKKGVCALDRLADTQGGPVHAKVC